MNLWLLSLYFLPVFGALKVLPVVNLEGELGGSITFECPLPKTHTRIYLCREMAGSGACTTVVSNGHFVKKEYEGRVKLKLCPDRHLFLVEMKEMTENDSGVYACGVGMKTDLGKTQQITLSISEFYPFWEYEPVPQTPRWFDELLYQTMAPMPPWFQMPEDASPSEFISKATTPAQRTQTPPVHHPSPQTPIPHRPPISRASSVAADKPPTPLPSTTASKTSAQEEQFWPQPASYNDQTRLHRQRAFNYGSSPYEDQGFHILIPTILGLMLLALLGMVVKRAIQRRKGSAPTPLPATGSPQPTAQPQVPEAPWFHDPPLKTDCEYVSCYHQPPAKTEDADSDDYVNIPFLTHLPSCAPRPGPLCP